jgi:hypothetical protein
MIQFSLVFSSLHLQSVRALFGVASGTFPVKLPVRIVPFKHVSTVNALADPEPIESLIITPDIPIGDFEESGSRPSKSIHDSGKHHFVRG